MRAIFITLAVLGLCVPLAFAQETTADAPEVQAEITQPLANEVTPVQETPKEDVDWDNPQVQEALKEVETQRAEAEAAQIALGKAVMDAKKIRADQTPVQAKSSLIPKSADEFKALGSKIGSKLIGWFTSPKFLAQLGAIAAIWLLAPLGARMIKARVPLLREAPAPDAKLRVLKHYGFRASNFLSVILLVALLAIAASVLKAIPALGADWLVKLAQGLAVVFLVFRVIKEFIKNPLIQKIAFWVVIPLSILMVIGFFDELITFLEGATLMKMGDTPISAMTLVKLGIFGGLFFWLGGVSNSKGQNAIRSQESLDIATREVVAKMFQIVLFIILFVLIMSFAGIPLSGLVVIFSAVGLGLGFGLQPIAANFISGIIILFDRTVKVGDYVVLPDGKEGFVEAINMRSTTVETTDGKDIMVPNTTFTEESYENWTHKDPRQRYEVHFSVAYDTDIDMLEDILIPEVLKHHQVLKEPEMPDLEFREFGENGIKMAIEFWCHGIDDGPNKFTSDLNFIVWRTLKANGIKIPFPQREVRNLN